MKKIILAGLLLAVGSVAMANSAQDVLKKARDDYYKQQEAERKAAKAPKKVERVKTETAEGVEEVEAEEDGHAEVVQLGNAAVVEGVGVVISFLHQRREGGEEEGDADLHEDGEGQGNTKGFICAFLGRDDEGGADDAAHDDVRWLRAGKRHKSHKHEFKGSAGDKPCLWVAHKDADDGTGDDRAVDVGQDVEEVDPRDAREDSNHERLDKGDVR